MKVNGFLVVRADGSMRITKKRAALRLNEVAFPLSVNIPTTWGRVQTSTIEVVMPEPPEARVTIGAPEMDGDE